MQLKTCKDTCKAATIEILVTMFVLCKTIIVSLTIFHQMEHVGLEGTLCIGQTYIYPFAMKPEEMDTEVLFLELLRMLMKLSCTLHVLPCVAYLTCSYQLENLIYKLASFWVNITQQVPSSLSSCEKGKVRFLATFEILISRYSFAGFFI